MTFIITSLKGCRRRTRTVSAVVNLCITFLCMALPVLSLDSLQVRLKHCYAIKDWKGAVNILSTTLERAPKNAEYLQSRGYCLLQLGSYDAALNDLDAAANLGIATDYLQQLRALARQGAGRTAAIEPQHASTGFLSNFHRAGAVAGKNVNEADHRFALRYKTPHLDVYTDLDAQKSIDDSEALEGFLVSINKNIKQLSGNYPVKVYAFKDQPTMQAYLKLSKPLYGTYHSDKNTFFTYVDSGFGTWTHEVMHKVLDDEKLSLDKWAIEGIPTIFEKVYGYPSQSGWIFSWGYQNPWRLKDLEPTWSQLRLSTIVTTAGGGGYSEAQERLVGLFLLKHNLLLKYLEVASNNNKGQYSTILEATFQKRMDELDQPFSEYLQTIKKRWALYLETPSSQYFPSKASYDQFIADNKPPI